MSESFKFTYKYRSDIKEQTKAREYYMSSFADAMKTASGEQESLDDLVAEAIAEVSTGKIVTKPGKVKSVEKYVPPTIQENEVLLSTLTKGRLPKSKIDHVIRVYPKGTFSSEHESMIPEVDDEYHWDPDVLEAIIIGDKLDERILLQGYPGTGKTTALNQYASWIRQPFLKVGGKDGIDGSSLLGGFTVTNGSTEFKLGMIPIGLQEKYLICIDEAFKLPAGIMMTLQSLLEHKGVLILDDMPGTPEEKTFSSEGARIFLTDNVLGTGDDMGKAAATQLQDTSTLDRIGLTVHVKYLQPKDETEMLMKKFPKQGKVIRKLVPMANLVREGYAKDKLALTFSPRGLISTLKMVDQMGLTLESAFDLAYMNKLADDVEKGTVVNFKRSTWGI